LESIIRKKEIPVSDMKKLSKTSNSSYNYYIRHVYKYAMLRGMERITMDQIQFIVSGVIARELVYNDSNYQYGRIATTIHGAKNREFDYVFILWPYKIQNNYEYQRKLLYNAVTRAKNNALLIVEGGEKRISKEEILMLLIPNYN
jgi:superfamily I DNA/RNA helicase